MSLTFLGSLSIGDAIPGAVALAAAGTAGINLALPDILARLAALQAFAPQPVSFAAQLALAEATLSSVQAAISLGLPAPDISAQIAQVMALIADLLNAVNAVNTQLAIITDFQALLGTAGFFAYSYAGTYSAMGGEISSEFATDNEQTNALLLFATTPAAWSTLGQIMKVTP